MLEELEPLDGAGAALELDEELESLGCVVEPAPAEPLGVAELELDGALLDEDDPPLALSFFWMSTEVDEELEPDGAGAAVVPEAELEDEGAVLGELVAPEPDGVVVDEDEDEPAGARDGLSDLLQPAIIAPPNARETARARVENFMWPPWLGYVLRQQGSGRECYAATRPPSFSSSAWYPSSSDRPARRRS